RQPDNTLHIVELIFHEAPRTVRIWSRVRNHTIAWIFKNDNIAAFDVTHREHRQRIAAGIEDKLVDDQVVAYKNRILHRTGRNRDRLQNERHTEQRHDERHSQRFKIFSEY